jgi:hypothetical protein
MSRTRFTFHRWCLAILVGVGTWQIVVAQENPPRRRPAVPDRPERAAVADSSKAVSAAPAPTGEPRQAIALTLWTLTIKESTAPESSELESELRDKVNRLPSVVGTQKEVRDMVAKLKVAGVLHKSREIRLLALAGESATALTGADQPVIQAMNFTPTGTTNSIMYRSIGTIVEAKPIVDSDGLVQVGLTYECSFLDDAGGAVIAELQDKEPIRAPAVVRKSSTSLVRLENGKAVLVSSDTTQDASNEENPGQVDLLILAAEIVSD